MFAYSWIKLNAVETELATLKALNATGLEQMATLSKQINKITGAGSGEQHIERLRAELAAGRYLIKMLGEVYSTHRVGFSGYLEGFSRRTLDGLWMTSFEMQNGGNSVRILGGALEPELIPKFIQGLSLEPSLVGTQFHELDISRKTKKTKWVEFMLSSGDFSNDVFGEIE